MKHILFRNSLHARCAWVRAGANNSRAPAAFDAHEKWARTSSIAAKKQTENPTHGGCRDQIA